MVHPPNTPREEPGKYGAIARDEESGVREAWMDETSTKQRVVDKPKKMRLKRRRRPPPPNTAPPEKLLRRIVRFFYDHLWIVFVAYVGVSVLCLRSLGEGDFNTNVDAAYFVAISTTTVGYGDMSPKTDKGKLFVMAFILTGVAMAGVFMTKVTDWILEAQERAMEKLTKKKQADMEADMAKLKAQVGARDGAGAASRAADAAAERKRTKGGEVTKITPVQKALVAMTAVILSGAAVMHSIEDISFLDGCYWSVVTSTTVGYGDVTPKTVDGKIFASMYAFITIGVMAWAIGQVADASVQSQVEHGAQVKAFKLTPEWLAAQGGEKGYVDQFDFAKAMLLSMVQREQVYGVSPRLVSSGRRRRRGDFTVEPDDETYGGDAGSAPISDCGTAKRPNAVNAPFDRAAKSLPLDAVRAKTGGDATTPIVTHCGGGGRGQKAKDFLMSQGYVNVINGGGPAVEELWEKFGSL